MKQEHTALPWDTKPTAGNHQHLIWNSDGKTIAVVYTNEADAGLITRAVNSHAAMCEALEALTGTVSRVNGFQHSGGTICADDWADLFRLASNARAALRLARED